MGDPPSKPPRPAEPHSGSVRRRTLSESDIDELAEAFVAKAEESGAFRPISSTPPAIRRLQKAYWDFSVGLLRHLGRRWLWYAVPAAHVVHELVARAMHR